jgi:hypothetical protein
MTGEEFMGVIIGIILLTILSCLTIAIYFTAKEIRQYLKERLATKIYKEFSPSILELLYTHPTEEFAEFDIAIKLELPIDYVEICMVEFNSRGYVEEKRSESAYSGAPLLPKIKYYTLSAGTRESLDKWMTGDES